MSTCFHPPQSFAVDTNSFLYCGDCGAQFFFRINRPPSGWGPWPLTYSLEDCGITVTKINCPNCWEEVELPDVYIEAIQAMDTVTFPCCKKVPVIGNNGILARVKRARKAE